MAAITAAGNGNWSAGATWNGGVPPGVGDTGDSNGFTVTIDQTITCTSLLGTNAGAGGFTISAAWTIAANIIGSVRTVLTVTAGAGVTVTVNGNVDNSAEATASQYGVTMTGAGILTITGNITGGNAATAHGVYHNTATGTLTVTGGGTITGGTNTSACGIRNNLAGTLNLTANLIGATGPGVLNGTSGNVTITGNVTGGALHYGLHIVATGTISVSGTATAAAAQAMFVGGAATVTVGNAIGGTASGADGISNAAGGTVNVTGTATGGSNATAYGVHNESTGTVNVNTVVGGSVIQAAGLFGTNSGGTTTFKVIGTQANGNAAIGGFCKMKTDATNQASYIDSAGGAAHVLREDPPAVTDVRDAVLYWGGTLEGELVVGGMLQANKRGNKQ